MTTAKKRIKRPRRCKCGSKKVREKIMGWWKCEKCAKELNALGRQKPKLVHQHTAGVSDVPSGMRGIRDEVERGFRRFCENHGLDRSSMWL